MDTTTGDSFTDYPSPYEALRREVAGAGPSTRTQTYQAPTTPGKQPSGFRHTKNMAATPDSSPFQAPATTTKLSTAKKARNATSNNDPLLHRLLDKNYRIQATPLKGHNLYSGASGNRFTTPGTAGKTKNKARLFDSSPLSSPEIEAPKLHAEIFSSPMRQPASARKPRTPGVSVLTPARKYGGIGTGAGTTNKGKASVWDDSDDDIDDSGDMDGGVNGGFGSPPKTMQFHVPQSRLMKTPG